MSKIISDLQCLESRRSVAQQSLDAERSAVERNRIGQFATPNNLALEVVHCAARLWPERTKQIRFADPSIGTGSFFSAALAVFGPDSFDSSVGIEIDSRFCAVARDLWDGTGLCVIEGDFTRLFENFPRLPPPNLILANPPYVRHHHMERPDKERLRRIVARNCGVNVNGLAGLYVYFVLLATAWMEHGGIAAWLIPSEFMDVNYGAALKRYLVEEVTLERIHRFDPADAQFGDALVSSAVLFFRKERPGKDHSVQFTYGGTLESPAAIESIGLPALHDARKWTVYPARAKNDRRVSGTTGVPTLGDYFRIQRGIATGANKFFILERDTARRLKLPEKFLRPILPSPRVLRTTEIERDTDGYPIIEPQLCLVDCDLPEACVKQRHPALWAYLQTASVQGLTDRYLCGKRNPWYQQEVREPSPFLITYMGRDAQRPFRFIWNRSQAIATNLFLMLYPKGAMSRLLNRSPENAARIHDLLNQISSDELRGEGRVYGGGLNKIEPRELARVSAARFLQTFAVLADSPTGQHLLFAEM